MSYKSLLNNIDELRTLVGDWAGQQPSQLEMDMALDRVKKIYELLRFSPLEEEQIEEQESESINIVPDSEPETEPKQEEVAETEPVEENDEEEMILDIDILKSANNEKYNKILSLYCDLEKQEPIITHDPIEEPEPEIITPITTPEPEPIIAAPVEQKIEQPKPQTSTVASHNTELYKISSQLGINDRFLLANDLFGGDISALSESLAKLDELTSLDDVMIYIAENYKWDGDSEGAKLLYTLLQNRFF